MELFASPNFGADAIIVVFPCCGAFLALCVGFVTFLTLYVRWRRKRTRQMREDDKAAPSDNNSATVATTSDRSNSSAPATLFNRNSANLLISLAFALVIAAIPGLISVCAFFAAFFSRTTAKVFGGMSFALISLYFVLILSLNSWRLGWVVDLLLSPLEVPFIGLMELSIVLSLVAVFVPLRSADKELPHRGRERGKPRWLIFSLSCLIVILITGYCVMQNLDGERGKQKTMQLLSGDESIHFDRFEIDYQQRRVICTDPVILGYLEERFLKADRDRDELGTFYQLTLYYKGGGHHEIQTYFNGDFILCLRNYHDEGMRPSHGILLTRPRAQAIDELVSFLKKDYREVAGTVMIVDSGTVRYERDEPLVAGYGIRQSSETCGMDPRYAKAIIFLAAIVMVIIRAPHGSRSRTVPVVKNRKGPLETLLLTFAWIAFFLPLVWIVSPLFEYADYPLFPIPFITGILCLILGLWLFYRSHKDLGTNWSITLEVREKHQLITHGVYRRVRHPMYLALLIYSLGQGLVLPNWLVGPSYGIAMLLIFAFRVGHEERMMLEEFGKDYEAYMVRSKRLIPGVW
jgi:protein-S-isoprenylcysteine O-methyltransferase Ste14